MKKKSIILLLNFTDWVLRTYIGKWECEKCSYYKGYFTKGIVVSIGDK